MKRQTFEQTGTHCSVTAAALKLAKATGLDLGLVPPDSITAMGTELITKSGVVSYLQGTPRPRLDAEALSAELEANTKHIALILRRLLDKNDWPTIIAICSMGARHGTFDLQLGHQEIADDLTTRYLNTALPLSVTRLRGSQAQKHWKQLAENLYLVGGGVGLLIS